MFPMAKPTSSPMSRPMFPGAGGYGGSVTMGQVARARYHAAGQTARNAAQASRMSEPVMSGVYGIVTQGQFSSANAVTSSVNMSGSATKMSPKRANSGLGQYSGMTRARRQQRARVGSNMAAANKRGINRPVVSTATSGAPVNAAADVVKESKKGMGLFKNPKKAALIGAGLAVAGSVAMNRRGEGASSGRQSMYRY